MKDVGFVETSDSGPGALESGRAMRLGSRTQRFGGAKLQKGLKI
jgi:hypothetical protein